MKKFLLKTSFLVMICLSFFIFSYFFSSNRSSKLEFMRNEADNSKKYIESNVRINELGLQSLKRLSESYLENISTEFQIESYPYFDLLSKKNSESRSFSMDEAILKNLHKDIGNITGQGDYENDKELAHEISMSLRLNESYKEIWDNSKHLGRIYYISEAKMLHIYPWISSDEFHYSDKLFMKEYYKKAKTLEPNTIKAEWSAPYRDDSGLGIITTLSLPVYAENKFRGVIAFDFTIKALSAILLENTANASGVILADGNNNLLGISNYEEQYSEEVLNIKKIMPKGMSFERINKLKDFDKVESIVNYYIVKRKIDGTPWNIYMYQKKSILNNKIFLEVSPMLIIAFALLIIYYELYSRKKSEKELEKVVRTLKRTTSKLEEESKTDHLTGLLNRRGIVDEIVKEHSRANRKKSEFSVMICDIDYFKRVNDTYGHDCGDYVLKELASLMKENVKEIDFVGRWGGEEFVILLVETSFRDAMKVADRLRRLIEMKTIEYEQHVFNCTMTFGVTEYNSTLSLDDNIAHADMALYQGKNTGRNRVVGSKKDGQYRTV